MCGRDEIVTSVSVVEVVVVVCVWWVGAQHANAAADPCLLRCWLGHTMSVSQASRVVSIGIAWPVEAMCCADACKQTYCTRQLDKEVIHVM